MKQQTQRELVYGRTIYVLLSHDRTTAIPLWRKEGSTRALLTHHYKQQDPHTADLFVPWHQGVRPHIYTVATITGNYYGAQRYCTALAKRLDAEGYTVRTKNARQNSMALMPDTHPDMVSVNALDLDALLDPTRDLYTTYVPMPLPSQRTVSVQVAEEVYHAIATNASMRGLPLQDYVVAAALEAKLGGHLTPLLEAREAYITIRTHVQQAYTYLLASPSAPQAAMDALYTIRTIADGQIAQLGGEFQK